MRKRQRKKNAKRRAEHREKVRAREAKAIYGPSVISLLFPYVRESVAIREMWRDDPSVNTGFIGPGSCNWRDSRIR